MASGSPVRHPAEKPDMLTRMLFSSCRSCNIWNQHMVFQHTSTTSALNQAALWYFAVTSVPSSAVPSARPPVMMTTGMPESGCTIWESQTGFRLPCRTLILQGVGSGAKLYALYLAVVLSYPVPSWYSSSCAQALHTHSSQACDAAHAEA